MGHLSEARLDDKFQRGDFDLMLVVDRSSPRSFTAQYVTDAFYIKVGELQISLAAQ
jgi:hypothetical protein